jgi:hypothetical protein
VKLSTADIMREMAGIKAENMEMVKLLATQLAEVRPRSGKKGGWHCGAPSGCVALDNW